MDRIQETLNLAEAFAAKLTADDAKHIHHNLHHTYLPAVAEKYERVLSIMPRGLASVLLLKLAMRTLTSMAASDDPEARELAAQFFALAMHTKN